MPLKQLLGHGKQKTCSCILEWNQYKVSKSNEFLLRVSHSELFMNKISMQSSKTALLSTLLFLTRLPRASDQDVVQGSRSRTPYSCPLPQSRGIPAIPTHPSARNSWHAVNVGSPQLCTDRHTCARFWFPSTHNSWFRNDALKSAAGEPLWDYACNCTLIR